MISEDIFALYNREGKQVSAKQLAFEDAQVLFPEFTEKNGTVRMDILPPGEIRKLDKHEVFFYAFPKRVFEVWDSYAANMRSVHDGIISTAFRKKLGDDNLAFDIAFDLAKEIDDRLFEIKLIERASLKEWLEGVQSGEPRGYFNSWMYTARCLLYDKSYYPPPAKYRKFPIFSKMRENAAVSLDHVRANNPQANVGFPYLRPWFDFKLTDAENDANKAEVRFDAATWIANAEALPDDNLLPTTLGQLSPPNAVFFRAQSRGRPVVGVSKIIALNEMRMSQAFEFIIVLCEWNATGDRLTRLHRMQRVLNGNVGDCIADGDDCAVKAGDGVVSADASAFDTSVHYFEFILWMRTLRMALELNEQLFNQYRLCLLASMNAENAANVGMVHLPPDRGLRSGCPSTHQIGTAIEFARMINCDWTTALKGISQMNKLGFYRPEKQFIFQDTITLSQLVVSKLRPGKIHGIMARAARALLEREDRESPNVCKDDTVRYNEIEDTRIIAICANLYGHPKYKEFVTWVAERWDVRIKYQRIVELIIRLHNRNLSSPGSSGTIEREALKKTWSIFFYTKASKA